MQLLGNTCLVVGASGAIGQAVAKKFHLEGARLALTYRNQKSAVKLDSLSSDDSPVAYFALDVRNQKQVYSVVSRVRRRFGPIDVLVNCSGVLGPVGATQDVSATAWRRTLEINLLGGFYLVRAVLPMMLSSGRGKIILFSGGGAAYARPHFTAYSSSKAAVVRFTESLSAELGDMNIQVNAIAPGAVKSRMWDELRASVAVAGPQAIEELKKMEITGGVPAERAASLALFLASNRSAGLTGRLISAVHDKWENMESEIPKVMSTDAWTLRRVPLDYRC